MARRFTDEQLAAPLPITLTVLDGYQAMSALNRRVKEKENTLRSLREKSKPEHLIMFTERTIKQLTDLQGRLKAVLPILPELPAEIDNEREH